MKQAVRELIGMVAVEEKETPEAAPQEDECAQAVIRTVEEILGEGRAGAGEAQAEEEAENKTTDPGREKAEEITQPAHPEAEGLPPEAEGTVVASGITILGDVRSEGDIDFRGVLKGNLAAEGDVVLSGGVLGEVSGRNVTIRCGVVQGNVSAAGAVAVEEGAVVIGNVTADAATISGRQKGDVRVERLLRLREKAVLVGDVTALSISVEEGARVQLGAVVSGGGDDFPEFAELEI